jgi:RsiW-degrading membrane proteinase PrsW (M82 family)
MLKFSLLQSTPTLTIAVIIFILIIIFYLLGYYLRRRANIKNPEKSKADLGALNGTLLGLLALLLAFTFGMSTQDLIQEDN